MAKVNYSGLDWVPDDSQGVDIMRQVLKIDPDTLRAVGEQYVCHRTPTPEGFMDVWDYRALLESVKDTYKFRLDEQGLAIVP